MAKKQAETKEEAVKLVKLAEPLKQNFTMPGGRVLYKGTSSVEPDVAKAMNFRLAGDTDEGTGACKQTKEEAARAKRLAEKRAKVIVNTQATDEVTTELTKKNAALALELEQREKESAAKDAELEEMKKRLSALEEGSK